MRDSDHFCHHIVWCFCLFVCVHHVFNPKYLSKGRACSAYIELSAAPHPVSFTCTRISPRDVFSTIGSRGSFLSLCELLCSYVRKPYLIRGRKFDIRLYVLVTGFNPLRVYVFEDGLVRFATQRCVQNRLTLFHVPPFTTLCGVYFEAFVYKGTEISQRVLILFRRAHEVLSLDVP